jgi:hypothetical protein
VNVSPQKPGKSNEKRLRDVMVNGFKAESIISIPEITNNL